MRRNPATGGSATLVTLALKTMMRAKIHAFFPPLAVGAASARLAFAALLVFTLAAPMAQARQAAADIAAMRDDIRGLREEVRALEAKTEKRFSDMVTELKLMRAYIDTAIAQSEARIAFWILGFGVGLITLVMMILPFYLALLRRVMPSLFGPVYPRPTAESGDGRGRRVAVQAATHTNP